MTAQFVSSPLAHKPSTSSTSFTTVRYPTPKPPSSTGSTSHSRSNSSPSPSKFRELPLSINPPPPQAPIMKSQFSPESPPGTPRARDIESRAGRSLNSQGAPRFGRSIRDRLTRFAFDVRTFGRQPDSFAMPIQPREWPPLHVEKRSGPQPQCSCHRNERSRFWMTIVAFIVLLYLLVDSIFLNLTLESLRHSRSLSITSNASANSSTTQLSADVQQCLTQYTLNAPSDPASYPCGTCLPALQAVPGGFDFPDPQDSQVLLNAVQFCALDAVFNAATTSAQSASQSTSGQSALTGAGWLKDVKFCAWGGVQCDGTGQIFSLTLSFPGVPSLIPNELGALTYLTNLTVTGNGVIPAGALPANFDTLSSLLTLHLESTAITALPDNLFTDGTSSTGLVNITTLELIKNANMGPTLPSSITGTGLVNLIVNSQPLTNPLSTLAGSPTLQNSLQLIDLTSTSLTGTVPASVADLRALTELKIGGNSLSGTLPSLPSSISVTTN